MPASRRAALAALPLALSLAACAPDAAPTAQSPGPGAGAARGRAVGYRSAGATQRRLERAAAGLYYTSESDYPFTYYAAAGAASGPLTVDAFRAAAGVPADSAVEAIALDAFFARHVELVDPGDAVALALVPRYERLKEEIRRAVREPRVFRVGRVLVRCYVVGTDGDGAVVGLTTWAVET